MTAILMNDSEQYLGISEVAESTGLSRDTLRWYEREGLLPRVERDQSRRRRYSPRDIRLLEVLVRLRRTGMPIREMREFIGLALTGSETHPRRLALLAAHRERIVTQLAQLTDDLATLDGKVEHYRWLMEQGLDCTDAVADKGRR